MAGANTLDTDKLVKLMAVAIIVIVVLIAGLFGMIAINMVSGSAGVLPFGSISSVADQTHTNQNIQNGVTQNDLSGSQQINPESDPAYQARQAYLKAMNEAAAKENVSDKSTGDTVKVVTTSTLINPDNYLVSGGVPADNKSTAYYQVIFEDKYILKESHGSLIAEVNRGPLVVHFEVSNPAVTSGSSTGSSKNKKYTGESGHEIPNLPVEVPYYCYAGIDIIDNKTGKVVATGGFGRTFPSINKQDVIVHGTGEYRIDYYGTGLDLDLKVITGATEQNPDAIAIDPSAKDAFSQLTRSGTKTVLKSGSVTGTSNENRPPEWW